MEAPPIWMVFVMQGLGVAGEVFGQRASRVSYNKSTMRTLVAVSLYSFIQCLVVLGIMQLALPEQTANQGPFTLPVMLFHHPELLSIGLVNLLYWICQIYLLQETLGVVLLVLAFLLATFFLGPFGLLFGVYGSIEGINPLAIVLGFVGTFFCVIELNKRRGFQFCDNWIDRLYTQDRSIQQGSVQMVPFVPLVEESKRASRSGQFVIDDIQEDFGIGIDEDDDSAPIVIRSSESMFKHAILVAITFITLTVIVSLYIILTVYFSKTANINMYGFTTLDQMLLPFFILPFVFISGRSDRIYKVVEPNHRAAPRQPFLELLKTTWRETSISSVFILVGFQGLLMIREFFYFYVSTNYYVPHAFLEMTLLRILLSWVTTGAVCLLVPRFIKATADELKKTFSGTNLLLRIVGSILVLLSLLLLNNVI